MKYLPPLTLAFLSLAFATALELTPENWDEHTAGKTVFLKFFAPWCGHCKKMKPDWDTLMDEYKDHPNILIADVDCIEAGKSLCQDHGVKGFPTVKYGDPSNLQDYPGGRDLASLQAHAAELTPPCTFDNEEHCTAGEIDTLAHIRGLSKDEIQAQIDTLEGEQRNAEEGFKKSVMDLQKQYETLVEEKERLLKAVKDQHLGLYLLGLKHHADKDEL